MPLPTNIADAADECTCNCWCGCNNVVAADSNACDQCMADFHAWAEDNEVYW